MNPQVDTYLTKGCGRCDLYDTPHCKVNTWRDELIALRSILLGRDLEEEVKWKQPCYTYNGKNVAMISALKNYASLSFFKGSLLTDPQGVLVKPGKNSQAARLIRFTSAEDVHKQAEIIQSLVTQAIEVEKSGKRVQFKKNPEPMPIELRATLNADPALKAAFDGLTPGRQRGYILYFSAPKQSRTRYARIEKHRARILVGKGFHDR